jgi:RND superfamily putative drug exporter
MNETMSRIEAVKSELGISGIVSSRTEPKLQEKLLSKDGTTLLAIVSLPKADFEPDTKTTLQELKEMLEPSPNGTKVALTGSAPLSQDFEQSSQAGLRRTELVTVSLVLAILLLVFRSAITPLIPLLTIGFSFALSRGLIATVVDLGMPVSHFTESFLISVLFGAGTDYCILMLQRYREELVLSEPITGDDQRIAAMIRTMKGVGKTIIYAAGTVIAAFALIGLAQFGLYRSAVGVAIGVIVTVLAGFTLTPALMFLFGQSLFRPFIRSNASSTSVQEGLSARVWGALALFTAKRSVVVLIVVTLLLAPVSLLFHGKRSFDDISEINSKFDSVTGLHMIEEAFGSGELFPVTIAVTSSSSMRSTSGLAALEQVSTDLARLDGIREVRSAVRPLGIKPEQTLITGQTRQLNKDSIIRAIMVRQAALKDGLQALALGAAPLSQGLIGIWPALRQLEAGFGRLFAAVQPEITKPASVKVANPHDEQAMDYYLSPDGRTSKFELILDSNPYSDEALDSINAIEAQARSSLGATAIRDPEAFVTGISAKYNELRDISIRDFFRTGVLVLVGIGLLLMLLLRSVLAPLYVLASLGLNYMITMGITEFVFVKVLGYSGLSWTVSYFIFLILVALGVDYSIFLMARFQEEHGAGEPNLAMSRAMRSTGGVIGSAALIMAGTFGALSFSGVDTLIQIGVGTVIGLTLYATVFMALVIPACSFLLGRK